MHNVTQQIESNRNGVFKVKVMERENNNLSETADASSTGLGHGSFPCQYYKIQ
jgi:hypothetical protein